MKKVIRLTESDLHRIVENSVKKILKESYEEDPNDYDIYLHNNDEEIETSCYKARCEYMRGNHSKYIINTILDGIKERDEEAYELIRMLKYNEKQGAATKFDKELIKKAEMLMDWADIDAESRDFNKGLERYNNKLKRLGLQDYGEGYNKNAHNYPDGYYALASQSDDKSLAQFARNQKGTLKLSDYPDY